MGSSAAGFNSRAHPLGPVPLSSTRAKHPQPRWETPGAARARSGAASRRRDSVSFAYLAILHVDLVAAQDHRDVFAHARQVAMPVGDVLVRDAGGDIKHDDRALDKTTRRQDNAAWLVG